MGHSTPGVETRSGTGRVLQLKPVCDMCATPIPGHLSFDMRLIPISVLIMALAVLLPAASTHADQQNDRISASTGNPNHGRIVYQRCSGCHSLERDRTGPRHCDLIGRRAGTLAGFQYTLAMQRSGIVWTRESLDAFLAAPLKVVPGTSMGFAGIEDRQARLDLIAYIEQAGSMPGVCRPATPQP